MYIYYIGKKITKNFTRREYYAGWRKGDGRIKMYENTMLFARIMQELRERLGMPIIVHSWFRTQKMNDRVKGHPNSNHLKGCAMDFHVQGMTINKTNFIKIAQTYKMILRDLQAFDLLSGLEGEAGLYNGWIHLGLQNYTNHFYHWDSRTGKQINEPFSEL